MTMISDGNISKEHCAGVAQQQLQTVHTSSPQRGRLALQTHNIFKDNYGKVRTLIGLGPKIGA
jgi:hypothetical protein